MFKLIQIGLIFCTLIIPSYVFAQMKVGCGYSEGACAITPVQSQNILNTQTTGAATTAVTVTLTPTAFGHAHIYSVEARCNTAANTSGLTVTDGGTTIWSTVATEVLAVSNFVRQFEPALTGKTGQVVVITLAACAAGTGTLIVQGDTW